jgi:hypothetical protein
LVSWHLETCHNPRSTTRHTVKSITGRGTF